MGNNGYIAFSYLIPDPMATISDYLVMMIGIVVLVLFWGKDIVIFLRQGKLAKLLMFTDKTGRYLGISLLMTFLLLITSEALFGLAEIEGETVSTLSLLICVPLGLLFAILSLFTIIYIYVKRNVVYTEDFTSEG